MISVYFISELGTDNFKIGITNNTPRRLKELQTANKRPLILRAAIETDTRKSAREIERNLHKSLSSARYEGEWFLLSPDCLDSLAAVYDLVVPSRH